MRHGTLPYRILHDLDRRGLSVFKTAQVAKAHESAQNVSRALRKLVDAGKIEGVTHGVYRVLSGRTPNLAFNRAWSSPGVDLPAEKTIAITLARPTFLDVARLCRAYGVERVRGVLRSLASTGDVSPLLASEWQHRLDNIQRGFADAARHSTR